MENYRIPESVKTRIPLIKDEWMEQYRKLGEHPHSPNWNTECGDRLTSDDIAFVRQFAEDLKNKRESFSQTPPAWLLNWAERLKLTTPWFRRNLDSEHLKEFWQSIPLMTRSDMQTNLDLIVPEDADLNRLVVNPTSGTTGRPIPAPNHPRAVGCYDPLIQYALERHGLKVDYNCGMTAAIQICSQKKTITYRTVHSYLNGAGFAKINLSPDGWKSPESAGIYLNDMKPVFLSGDPFSFMEYIRLEIPYRPEAILTTALHLEKSLRVKLEKYFGCPVVDMYSLNETGPVAYSCPEDPSRFHMLPHDLFAEIIDPRGKQLPEGATGGIALSGGRNPYLPLLRYMTGDSASINYGLCSCGEKTPALTGLQGRAMVLYRTKSGKIINSIDIAGIIRMYPVYFFRFVQRRDYSCSLSLSAGSELSRNREESLKNALVSLFNFETEIFIDRDLKPGDGKNTPFVSEI